MDGYKRTWKYLQISEINYFLSKQGPQVETTMFNITFKYMLHLGYITLVF